VREDEVEDFEGRVEMWGVVVTWMLVLVGRRKFKQRGSMMSEHKAEVEVR
jgi:hypothetical protein